MLLLAFYIMQHTILHLLPSADRFVKPICVHHPSPSTQMTLPHMTGVIVFHHYPPALRPQALHLKAVFIFKDTTKRIHVIKPESVFGARRSRCFHGNTCASSWIHVPNVKGHGSHPDRRDKWHIWRHEMSEVCIVMQGRISQMPKNQDCLVHGQLSTVYRLKTDKVAFNEGCRLCVDRWGSNVTRDKAVP